MKDLLGLMYLLRFHPFWNRDFKREFGSSGILLFIGVWLVFLLYPRFDAHGEILHYLLAGLLGFTLGVLPALLICQIKTITKEIASGVHSTPWLWVLTVVSGALAMVLGVLQEMSIVRLAHLKTTEGALLVILGFAAIYLSTQMVWRKRHRPIL